MAATSTEAPAALDLRQSSVDFAVAEEQKWAAAGERLRGVNLSERYLELKERELQNVIAANYARIQGVEKELQGLQLQLKLTSGPKRSALEMMRRKIEAQTERVISARADAAAAQKLADVAAERLKMEERAKEQLCQELNLLVQQSAHAQLEKLETLTQRLEALNAPTLGGLAATAELQQRIAAVAAGETAVASAANSVVASHAVASSSSAAPAPAAASATPAATSASTAIPPDGEAAAKAAAAAKMRQEAAAARSRHVTVSGPRHTGSPAPGRGGGAAQQTGAAPVQPPPAARAQAGTFRGFD